MGGPIDSGSRIRDSAKCEAFRRFGNVAEGERDITTTIATGFASAQCRRR
jgi:hypothetical protein